MLKIVLSFWILIFVVIYVEKTGRKALGVILRNTVYPLL